MVFVFILPGAGGGAATSWTNGFAETFRRA